MKTDGIELITGNIVKGNESVGASAWVSFQGTGVVAIREFFNVSSITDLSVGNYRVNFGIAMTKTNYAVAGTGQGINGIGWFMGMSTSSSDNILYYDVNMRTGGGIGAGPYDPTTVNIVVYGGI